MSTISEEGVMTVKTEACNQLLAQRVEVKMKSKKAKDVMNRLHVAIPTQRDQKEKATVYTSGIRVHLYLYCFLVVYQL